MNALVAEARRMAPSLSRGIPVVYFLRLQSGIIYIGASLDLAQRIEDHVSGQACRTIRLDAPAGILRVEIHSSFSEARSREAQLKRWSHAKKKALIRGDRHTLKTLSGSRAAPPGPNLPPSPPSAWKTSGSIETLFPFPLSGANG